MARSVPGVGQVLVTGAGYTLYLFQPGIDLSGGAWYVLRPSGAALIPAR
jgi:hypothetical protein